MAQRLVDLVDHADIEHDGLQVEGESVSFSSASWLGAAARAQSLEILASEQLTLAQAPGSPFSPLTRDGALQVGLDFLSPVTGSVELAVNFSTLAQEARRPGHTLEDVTIFENIRGL